MNSNHILITGASGLIGTRLTELLQQRGHTIAHLGRSKKEGGSIRSFIWDIDKFGMEPGVLQNIDTIIHLAGAGLADKPWTERRKKVIVESRVRSSKLLHHELSKPGHAVRTFISASGAAYYGMHDNGMLFTEDDGPGDDFLAGLTKKWEDEADKIAALGVRVVKIRTSMVLSNRGGALEALARPVRWYAGAAMGTGRQSVSWIHLDDLCNMYIKAVEEEGMKGAYNGVAPEVVTNREMMKAIARALKKPLILPPVPAFALKLFLGEMADMVLKGNRLSCEKALRAGFKFRFDTLEKALNDLFNDEGR